jgi:hypothetical protein
MSGFSLAPRVSGMTSLQSTIHQDGMQSEQRRHDQWLYRNAKTFLDEPKNRKRQRKQATISNGPLPPKAMVPFVHEHVRPFLGKVRVIYSVNSGAVMIVS